MTRLQWRWISWERQHFCGADLHKNGSDHAVPLNQATVDVVERVRGHHNAYFFTDDGKPVVQVNTKAWHKAPDRAGIEDFRWHDLRHTFATWLREAETLTHELQRLCGWKAQPMVERYAHAALEGLQYATGRLDAFHSKLGFTHQSGEKLPWSM